jgi:hypothetical protein
MSTITKRPRRNPLPFTRSTRGQFGTLVVAFLGSMFTASLEATAQIVGTADPTGLATLNGPNGMSTSMPGNPLQLNSTLQSNGLTVTGVAQNNYSFTQTYQAAEAGATLSFSGLIGAGNGGVQASLKLTSNIFGMNLGPAPVGNSDYNYYDGGFSVLVTGMLAPGDRVIYEFDGTYLAANGFQTEFSLSNSFTNTGTSSISIQQSVQDPINFLGDWYAVRQSGAWVGGIQQTISESIIKSATSSPDESWIEVDPTVGATETVVPEPSSLLLSAFGILSFIAYAAVCQRLRPGGCGSLANHR